MLSPIFQHFGVLECLASEAVWRLYGYKFAPNFGGSVAMVGSHYRHTTANFGGGLGQLSQSVQLFALHPSNI